MNPTPDIEPPVEDLPQSLEREHVLPSPNLRQQKRGIFQRIRESRFLWISIAAHVLFALAATAFVVEHYYGKRKLTFQGGPPSRNPSQRATEHKVQMAQKQKTMSAPAQAKRIVSKAVNTKVALPEMPSMSAAGPPVPGKMAGMGGTGVGIGPNVGAVGGPAGGMGGGPIPFFGFKQQTGGGARVGT